MTRTLNILQFLDLAFRDYVAARTLMRSAFLLQGSQLGAASLEKILKAILAVRGNECRGHLNPRLLRSVEQYQPGLWSELDKSFIALLQKCYDFRYLDDSEPEDGVVLHQMSLLHELDRTYMKIDRGFRSATYSTPYQQALVQRDPAVCEENASLEEDRVAPDEPRRSIVHQYLVDEHRNLVVLNYSTFATGGQAPFAQVTGVRDTGGVVRMRVAYTPTGA